MAIKKSELYSSLWASCDELRGGMDASQYKDYVLVMLFIKYVSDKFAGVPYAPITIPKGASFSDMVALKGKPTIGDDINKKIIGPISDANKLSDMPDFNDVSKLGSGKEMVDRLTNLIAIFENKALDFSKNRAEGDDILGDAYEYLMRHFATESGKSKGQFYTPAEVSRIMAKIIGINPANTSAQTTAHDPTSGSGSLLLKVADEAGKSITLYGQEKDTATAGLARMNMILHNNPTAEIKQGNTLANPLFLDANGALKTYDYVVANPPFSDKRWGNGVDAVGDTHGRFKDYGIPPAKNGDYAYLLHIIRTLKTKGKGACILPHGVLFRGNAEAEIRKNIIRKGYIKGIIGLPANLFYGTGIPACIIVLDKENAHNRKGIFMIDAGKGFMKDGNKNRLRSMDIHRIVDVFNKQIEIAKYSKMVPFAEIEKNEYNLNIPRYIDSQEAEDIQNIEAHLLGDIPGADIDALGSYWEVCPTLKDSLFGKSKRKNYMKLKVEKDAIKKTIIEHPEFEAFTKEMNSLFAKWKKKSTAYLKELKDGLHPKDVIFELSESLLVHYTRKNLINKYDVYQHLMDYWAQTMQDDIYELAADGWKAGNEVNRIEKKTKKGDKEVIKQVAGIEGLEGRLIAPPLLIRKYFAKEQKAIDDLESQIESLISKIDELREEHGGEDGLLSDAVDDKQKISKKDLQQAIKDLGKRDTDNADEYDMLQQYKKLMDDEADLQSRKKAELKALEALIIKKYPLLSIDEIKTLVVDDKWMATIAKDIHTEMDRISQRLTQWIRELAERYETPLPQQTTEVSELETKVNTHLEKMGFVWK
jgi:type I restriction enzyme M protein